MTIGRVSITSNHCKWEFSRNVIWNQWIFYYTMPTNNVSSLFIDYSWWCSTYLSYRHIVCGGVVLTLYFHWRHVRSFHRLLLLILLSSVLRPADRDGGGAGTGGYFKHISVLIRRSRMCVWDGEYREEIDAERWTKAFTRRSHSMVDGWRSGSHSSQSVIIILAGRSCAGCKFVMYVMTGWRCSCQSVSWEFGS